MTEECTRCSNKFSADSDKNLQVRRNRILCLECICDNIDNCDACGYSLFEEEPSLECRECSNVYCEDCTNKQDNRASLFEARPMFLCCSCEDNIDSCDDSSCDFYSDYEYI